MRLKRVGRVADKSVGAVDVDGDNDIDDVDGQAVRAADVEEQGDSSSGVIGGEVSLDEQLLLPPLL